MEFHACLGKVGSVEQEKVDAAIQQTGLDFSELDPPLQEDCQDGGRACLGLGAYGITLSNRHPSGFHIDFDSPSSTLTIEGKFPCRARIDLG